MTHEAVEVEDLVAVVDVATLATVDVLPGETTDDRGEGGDVTSDEEEKLDDMEAEDDASKPGGEGRVGLGRLKRVEQDERTSETRSWTTKLEETTGPRDSPRKTCSHDRR